MQSAKMRSVDLIREELSRSLAGSKDSLHGTPRGERHVVTMATPSTGKPEDDDEENSDPEMEITPKTIRRYLSTISDSDEDEDSDSDALFLLETHSHQSGTDVTSVTTRNSSINHSERSQSICADKLSAQEQRFMEQMRVLRKFIRDRNNLIAGQEERGDEDKSQYVPPDGGWGWVIVLSASLVFFFAGGLSRCFTLIYLQFLEVFHQSAAATSATASIFGAVKMCTSPIVSMLCHRFSKQSVAVCGGIITGFAMVMTSYPLSLEYVYFSYGFIAAFGINMVLTPCFVVLGEYFKKKRARAMSVAMLGGSLGGMVLPPLVSYLFDCYGYSGAMLIYSGLMFNICIAGMLFRPVKLLSRAEVERKKEAKRRKKALKRAAKSNGHCGSSTAVHENGRISLLDDEENEKASLAFDDEGPPPHMLCTDSIGSSGSLNNRSRSLSNVSIASSHKTDTDVETNTRVQFAAPENEEKSNHDAENEEEKPAPRKRRVSFQISTNLIPAVKYDGDGDSQESSIEEKREPSKCEKRIRQFFYSFGFRLFKKPRFLFYSLLMLASILSLSISGTFLSGLVSDLGLDKTHTSIMLSVSAFTDVPSKFASGFIFDLKKIRPYRSLPLAGLGFVTGAFALGIGFSQDYTQLFIVFIMYNFFASAYHTQHATVLADLVGAENLSAAMGLCRLCQGIGFCLGPTIGGHLKDITGRYQNAYLFSGSVLLLATLVYTTVDQWFLWRKRRIERAAYFPKGHYARYRHDSIAVT